ncbi:MAG: 50S ribosomal protein L24 [Candidatus Peribacteraceae bacterium]|jgi:large subunit ribosomal protein L24
MKLHTGDTVVVISGKDKGKTGSIMRVIHARNHVVVGGINMRTRHIKKTYQEAGRIVKYEASMNASKVMLVDPKTKKPTRIGFAIKEGKKVRIAKRSGEVVRKVAAPRPASSGQAKKTDASKAAPAKKEEVKKEAPTGKPTKQPFWKKLQFGSAEGEGGAPPDEARSKQDHTIPSQNIPPKTSGRGS